MPLTKVSSGVIAANAVVDSFGTQSITGDKLGLTAINANNIVNATITGNLLTSNCVAGNNIVASVTLTTPIISGNLNLDSTGTSGIRLPAANTLAFHTAGTEDMRIDSAGNVGIGTSSPGQKLEVLKAGGGAIRISETASRYVEINGYGEGSANGSVMAFNTITAGTSDLTERGRFDNAGNFLVGVTSTLLASGSSFVNDTLAGDSPQLIVRNAQNTVGRYWKIGAVGGAGGANPYMIVYTATNGGVYMGYSDTSWSSTSDESKKENLVPITDAVTKISSLRTVIGNFIDDEEKTKHPFLIAQDVQKVLPEAINEKDGVLGLKYSDMIPLLTAAIKEQQAIITDLKARIEVLEAQ